MLKVDEAGSVQAVTSGTGSVLVEAGKLTKQVDVLIQIAKRIEIQTTSPMPLMLGVLTGFKATVFDDRNQPMIAGEIRWTSSDPEIFTVDDRGNVKTHKEGEATLTVHAAGIQGTMKVDGQARGAARGRLAEPVAAFASALRRWPFAFLPGAADRVASRPVISAA